MPHPDSTTARPLYLRLILSPWWLLLAILICGWFLRTQRATEVSYWFDESFCVRMAEFPVAELITRSGRDTHPPLFFLVLKLWLSIFEHSTATARMLSAIWGLLAIAGVFLFVRDAYRIIEEKRPTSASSSTAMGLLAALFVALSPIHTDWALQVRMYTQGTALTIFSSWFLIRALRGKSSSSLREWSLYSISVVLLIYTHYYALMTALVQYLFAAGYLWFSRRDKKISVLAKLKPVILSAGCVALAWLPWLPTFLDQRGRVVGDFWTQPLDWESMGREFYRLFVVPRWSPISTTTGLILAQISLVTVIILPLGKRMSDSYIALAGSVPILIAILLSSFSRNILVYRYFMFAHLFLMITAAVLLCRIRWRAVRYPAVALAIGTMVMISGWYFDRREEIAEFPGMKETVKEFEALRKPTEPLIVCNPMLFTSVVAYTDNRDDIFLYQPQDGFPFYFGTAVIKDQEYLSPDQINKSGYQTVWTFDANRWRGGESVLMPTGWEQIGETRFQESSGEFVLRLYRRINGQKKLADSIIIKTDITGNAGDQ